MYLVLRIKLNNPQCQILIVYRFRGTDQGTALGDGDHKNDLSKQKLLDHHLSSPISDVYDQFVYPRTFAIRGQNFDVEWMPCEILWHEI